MDMPRSASNETQSPSELPSSASSLLVSEPRDHDHDHDDPLELLTEGLEHRPFTTIQGLRRSVEHCRRALEQDKTRDQYLVFTSVPPAVHSRLSEEESRLSKHCRLSFNPESGILVAKIMPYNAHETAIRKFDEMISYEIRVMNLRGSIWPSGSTTVTVGNWKKEADSSWSPVSQFPNLSFAMEVGLSESTRRLALDARGWLETPSSSVELMVTIDITRHTPEITLHRWERAPRVYGLQTRSQPVSANRTGFITLSRANNVTAVAGQVNVNGIPAAITHLPLPFDKIMGRDPQPPLERDFILSNQELRLFAEAIWGVQGFM